MARLFQEDMYDISFHGIGFNEIEDDILNDVLVKIGQYARGAPVRAKVILVRHVLPDDDMDALGIFKVGFNYYFVGISNAFMIVMDLHYVKSSLIARYLDRTIHLA